MSAWDSRPPGTTPTMAELADQIDVLTAAMKANGVPTTMAALQRKLELTWHPDATVLLQAGSVPSTALAPVPHLFVYRNVATAVANATATPLVWDTIGTSNDWPNPLNGVIPVSGLYAFGCSISWPVGATGWRYAFMTKGAANLRIPCVPAGGAGDAPRSTGAVTVRCVAGDVMGVSAFQTSGAPVNTIAGIETSMNLTWMGN